MSDRSLRKRIPEELEFVANKGTYAARKILMLNHNIIVELWFHKHYYERLYIGDAKGKRDGIEPAIVESFVERSIEHLFFYSTVVKGFNFVNYRVNKKHSTRIVLQEAMFGSTLNVVIEVYFLSVNHFEVTVITAFVNDNFKMGYGQYCIKLQQDRSLLKQFNHGKFFEICSIKFA